MADAIEKLIKEAVIDRIEHRRRNHSIDAAASNIRIVALLDCLFIVDSKRAAEVVGKMPD